MFGALNIAASMIMAVMLVWPVLMIVRHGLVFMLMRMCPLLTIGMVVRMMNVLLVRMSMTQPLVTVRMRMLFGQYKPDPHGH